MPVNLNRIAGRLTFALATFLSPANWTDLARVAVTGAVTVATDTNVVPARFYRALVP